MYQALYRKWRPRTFADVVGQEHITETLRRQVAQDRLSHAYLFTGTRGTGKTTCAKILAKAVNCEHPVNGDPCGECAACRGIDDGSLLDVLELDAASNNGVDHVRALRDEAIYSPASVRYRVYIVDEVHMLSTAAFNALLKILEEPPAHLIFILATTELHKVPATILSRCQRFAFKRIQPEDIAKRLLYVASQEKMELTAEAAGLISRLADGALRDALSLLDQCGASGGTIDGGRVMDVLGLAGRVQTAELMGYLLDRDVESALLLLDKLYSGGKDVGALLGELSALTRDLLIHMTAPKGGSALLSGGYDDDTIGRLSGLASASRLIYMATQLRSAAAALPMSPNRRTDGELCLIRLCDESLCGDTAALAARLTRLEERGAGPIEPQPRRERSAPRPAPRREAPQPQAAIEMPPLPEEPSWDFAPPPMEEPPVMDTPPWEETAPAPKKAAPRPVEPAPAPAPEPKAALQGDALWEKLEGQYLARLGPLHQALLDDAKGFMEGDALVIQCRDDFAMEEIQECREVFQTVTAEHLGHPVAVRFTVASEGGGGAAPRDKLEDLIRVGQKYDSFTVK